MKYSAVMAGLLLLTALLLPAAEQVVVLDIDKAVQLALENNKGYRVSLEEVRRFQHKVHQNLGFLPTVTLEGTDNLAEKLMEIELPPLYPGAPAQKTSLDFTRKYEFTLQIVQPVFTGGKLLYAFKNARLDLDIAEEKKENARKELVLNVKKVFYNILVMEEVLKAHNKALELAQTNFNNVDEKYRLGMVSKYDRLRAELAVAAIRPDILQAEKVLELSRLNLKILTGLDLQTPVTLNGELSYTPYSLQEAAFISGALTHASEITQLKLEMQKARNLLKIAYGQFMPDISVVAAYTYRSDALRFNGSAWENFYSINLAFRFPIFTGLRRSAEVGEIKVMGKILDLNLQQLNDALTLKVKELNMTLKQEYENIQRGLKNIETAKEGVRIARLTYGEGLISILELNTSITELTGAKVNYLRAVYNYTIAAAELEKISGLILK
jgi:outer membrane protein TolC